jgi:pimeloyl-ACP methyl ester carboxylesterase
VTPVEQLVELRAGSLRFRVLSAGRGTPLVYFHSLHERSAWSPFLDRLARRCSVWAPLHPGVGGSDGVETLDDVVDLALAYDELLERLGLGRPSLCGHFFGAMVAAELASIVPSRAARLALISPLGLWRADVPVADTIILPRDELAGVLWTDPASPAAREWAREPDADEERAAAQVETIQRLAAMARFVWPIPDKGITKRLHRISAPTLLVWGDDDRANPPVYAEEWQHRIIGAALRRVAGGHMLPHESPDLVADLIAEFIG